jgi:hypothetical protein
VHAAEPSWPVLKWAVPPATKPFSPSLKPESRPHLAPEPTVMAELGATSNHRTQQCVVVGTLIGKFVMVPLTPVSAAKPHVFVYDFRRQRVSWEEDAQLYLREAPARAKRGDKTSRGGGSSTSGKIKITSTNFFEKLAAKTPAEVAEMDFVRAELTLVDAVPPHMAFVVREPQGPLLRKIVLSNRDSSRAGELSILKAAGFPNDNVMGNTASLPEVTDISDADMIRSLPPCSVHVRDFAKNEFEKKWYELMFKRIEPLKIQGRVPNDFEMESIDLNIDISMKHLREWVVKKAVVRVGDVEQIIRERSAESCASTVERILTGEGDAPEHAAKRRRGPATGVRDFAAGAARALLGPNRLRLFPSLVVALRVVRDCSPASVEAIRALAAPQLAPALRVADDDSDADASAVVAALAHFAASETLVARFEELAAQDARDPVGDDVRETFAALRQDVAAALESDGAVAFFAREMSAARADAAMAAVVRGALTAA